MGLCDYANHRALDLVLLHCGSSSKGIFNLWRVHSPFRLPDEPSCQGREEVELLSGIGLDHEVVPIQWPHPQVSHEFLQIFIFGL